MSIALLDKSGALTLPTGVVAVVFCYLLRQVNLMLFKLTMMLKSPYLTKALSEQGTKITGEIMVMVIRV
jgi:hypothetical protein